MRWLINSIAFLLFLLFNLSFTNLTSALDNNQSGFLVGVDTSSENLPDSLALGVNVFNLQVHKGLTLGVVNPQLSQVAGVSTAAAGGSKSTLYTSLAILTSAFLAYYLITKNFTAYEKPLHQ